jgi:20S proteasome subunit beta 7
MLQELSDDDFCLDDGHSLKPAEVHSYLARVLYNRRNK